MWYFFLEYFTFTGTGINIASNTGKTIDVISKKVFIIA